MKKDKDKPPRENILPKSNSHKKNNNRKDLIIYIYNMVEDEWEFVNSFANKQKRILEIEDLNATTDSYLFANSDKENFIYVSPRGISSTFKKYFQQLTNNKKVDVFIPKRVTGAPSKDLYLDSVLFNRLITKAKKFDRVLLYAYSTSSFFLDLKKKLIRRGINVVTPESPDDDAAWTVNFFGSKSGIRQLAQQSQMYEPDFIMPEGLICVGKNIAAKIAANRYLNKKGVVIKTNKGSGGSGVLIFRSGDLSVDYTKCERQILEYFNGSEYWDKFPVVIEDLIKVDYTLGGGFPNIEFKIHKNGRIEMLYYCIMKVTREGKYYGLDMHEEVLPERVAARIVDMGYYIAEKYAMAGYRGHFDIDLIAAKNGQIYVCESNVRNTGGTDIFKLTEKLFGPDFLSETYVVNRNNLKFSKSKKISFRSLVSMLEPVLYNSKKKEGVVISSEQCLKFGNSFLYTVFGRNKKRAYQQEVIMKDLLKKYLHLKN